MLTDSILRAYETLYIIRPTLDEEGVDRVIATVEEYIKGLGGTVESTDKKGRRRLSYEVKKMRDGYYVLTNFLAKPELITAIKRMMSLSDDIIRTIVVVRDQSSNEQQLVSQSS
ncbi:MAG: 30S ribosomal protein S6 [Candidatus Melainabacteria bacterium]|nr:30S ribosomal protein S6 [Candidatus Melainabacteria bacterium]